MSLKAFTLELYKAKQRILFQLQAIGPVVVPFRIPSMRPAIPSSCDPVPAEEVFSSSLFRSGFAPYFSR
jgi:hypothetical protein